MVFVAFALWMAPRVLERERRLRGSVFEMDTFWLALSLPTENYLLKPC